MSVADDTEVPTVLPSILLVETRGELHSADPGFHDTLREMAAGRFELAPNTWTDALMRSFLPEYKAILLDCGRLGEFELDVIHKLKLELDLPIILHSTEDRVAVLKAAQEQGVSEVCRKPHGIAKIVDRILEHLYPEEEPSDTSGNNATA